MNPGKLEETNDPLSNLTCQAFNMAATKEMVVYVFDNLLRYFDKEQHIISPSFENDSYPLFVSYHKIKSNGHNQLRGCKGSFRAHPLHSGLADFALNSAFDDNRFSPVDPSEVQQLEASVNLLFQFENARDAYDWEVGVHGIIIDFSDPNNGKHRNATYLPHVTIEQGWDHDQALESLIRKAGYNGKVTPSLIASIKLTRYQSSETSMGYEDYLLYKDHLLKKT
ncbi:hypothetical protein PROFUN_15999 [Planoprotostelium fungivorum]|uniref:AMMECR1 domain-containing protein n=1 Tax=Planoprotostelium fungivorum TaxID=1890364 RepID=A0A2P6MTG4_9EUKA|nr:hypothetical protein PROFUN_15999 [Planoprotostelium fungivorum]